MVAQPTELNRLKFSNQALAARLSKQLGPGVGSEFSCSALTHNLGHLDQGKVELAFVFGSSVETRQTQILLTTCILDSRV